MPDNPHINLVTAMIKDAKVNMVILHNFSLKRRLTGHEALLFRDSRSWLQNKNGGLESLLSLCPAGRVEDSLRALNYFAIEGYKSSSALELAEVA